MTDHERAFLRHPNAVKDPAAFYIGWRPSMPPAQARRVRRLVLALGLALLAVNGTSALQLGNGPPGVFEFGSLRELEGVFSARPVPTLRVRDPAGAGAVDLYLVGAFKYGVPEELLRLDGQLVRLRGTLIQQGGVSMVEVSEPDSVEARGAAPPELAPPEPRSLGARELVGELVDTKCFFGVMRPGLGKVHRGCAIRCLSGGVPPGLLVRHPGDLATVVMLVDAHGDALEFDPRWAALELRVRGKLESHGGIPVLRTTSMELVDPGEGANEELGPLFPLEPYE